MIKECYSCRIATDPYRNFCSWRCSVDDARKRGVPIFAPNDLSIRCIGALQLECEYGSHPDYLFPITVEWFGPRPDRYRTEDDDNECGLLFEWELGPEGHTVIGIDESIVTTLSEATYYTFSTETGLPLTGYTVEGWKDWRIDAASMLSIKEWIKSGRYVNYADPQ